MGTDAFEVIAEIEGTFTTGARRVFPLGFGWQSVVGVALIAQPLQIFVGVKPTDTDHGMLGALLEARMAPVHTGLVFPGDPLPARTHRTRAQAAFGATKITLGIGCVAGCVDKGRELTNGDLVAAKGQGLCNTYPLARPFIRVPAGFRIRAPQPRLSGRDQHHLRTLRAVTKAGKRGKRAVRISGCTGTASVFGGQARERGDGHAGGTDQGKHLHRDRLGWPQGARCETCPCSQRRWPKWYATFAA